MLQGALVPASKPLLQMLRGASASKQRVPEGARVLDPRLSVFLKHFEPSFQACCKARKVTVEVPRDSALTIVFGQSYGWACGASTQTLNRARFTPDLAGTPKGSGDENIWKSHLRNRFLLVWCTCRTKRALAMLKTVAHANFQRRGRSVSLPMEFRFVSASLNIFAETTGRRFNSLLC